LRSKSPSTPADDPRLTSLLPASPQSDLSGSGTISAPEDIASDQLGTRFFFQHGEAINAKPAGERK
jgi:hypothetical protein